jgi:hypothetical protein
MAERKKEALPACPWTLKDDTQYQITWLTIYLYVKSPSFHLIFGPPFTPEPLFQWYLQSKEILYIKAKMVSVHLFVRPGADLGFRTSTDKQDQVLKSRSLDGRGGRRRQMAAATILSRCDQRSLLASLLVVNCWWWGIYIFIDKCSDVDHIINSSLKTKYYVSPYKSLHT